ncbi:MAG: hypothetical protein AB7N53_15730 [Candidatus Binatia bacterium]
MSQFGRGLTSVAHLRRRQFLRLTAVSAGATLASLAVSACGGDSKKTPSRVTAFRLSTHGERTCGACKAHGANRFYRTREAADADRAHLGCNCKIVTHPISADRAKEYFRDGDAFDKRSA